MNAVWESGISDTFLTARLTCPIEQKLFKSWGKQFHNISISSQWAFYLCLDPIIISSVLATFKLNLLTLSQEVRLLSSEVTASIRSALVFVN